MDHEDAINKLDRQIDKIDFLESKTSYDPEFTKWHVETENLIDEIFEDETHYLDDFNSIYFTPLFLSCKIDDSTFREAYLGGLEEARSLLLFLVEELE